MGGSSHGDPWGRQNPQGPGRSLRDANVGSYSAYNVVGSRSPMEGVLIALEVTREGPTGWFRLTRAPGGV